MAAPQIRFLIKADGAPDAVAALRQIREEEQRLAKAEKEAAAASKSATKDRQGGLNGLLSTAMSVKGFFAGALVSSMLAFGKATFDASVEFDSLSRGLKAALPAGADLNTELKALEQTAKMPGLGFKEAIQMSIRLQASGMSADRARKAMEAFGNALAIVGKGKAELDGVAMALSQIQAKGKVSAEEINQLAERVPQIRQIMEKAFGTSNTEILQQGGIGAKEFVDTVVDELGRLPKVTGGMKNDLENLDDNWFKLKKTIGDTFAPSVAAAIGEVNKAFEAHDGALAKATATAFKWGLEWSVKGLAGMALDRIIDKFRGANKEAGSLSKTLDEYELKGKPKATAAGQKDAIDRAIGASAGGSVAGLYGGGQVVRVEGTNEKVIQEQASLRKQLRLTHKKDNEELIAEELKFYRRRIEMAHGDAELIKEIEHQHQMAMEVLTKKGHKARAKVIRDYADEILSAQKAAAEARSDAENIIQQEMIRTQEEAAQRQYDLGQMSVDAYFDGRRAAMDKQQSAEQARLAGRFGAIVGASGASLSGADLMDAATSAKLELESQFTGATRGRSGEQNVKRLQQIKELEKLIAELKKEQEQSTREIAGLDEKRQKAKYAEKAAEMDRAMALVKRAQQDEEDKYARGEQSRYQTDRNINAIEARNQPFLREALQGMNDAAITPEQVKAVQDMTTAFKEWGKAAKETNVAMLELKGAVGNIAVQNLTQGWMDLATAQKSVGTAALDMAENFVQALLQMITEAIMMKAVFSALGLPMPAGSLASMFSAGGAVQKKATGGAIYGPGTGHQY